MAPPCPYAHDDRLSDSDVVAERENNHLAATAVVEVERPHPVHMPVMTILEGTLDNKLTVQNDWPALHHPLGTWGMACP